MNVLQDTSAGGRLGEALGSGLQRLAQSKINEIDQRNERMRKQQAFKSLPGSTPELADFLSNLSPEEMKNVWPSIGGLMQLFNQQSAGSGQPGMEGQPGQQQEFQEPDQRLPEYQKMSPQQTIEKALAEGRVSPLSAAQYLDRLEKEQKLTTKQNKIQQQLKEIQEVTPQERQQERQELGQLTPQQQALQDAFKSPQQKYQEQRIKLAEQSNKLAQSKEESREKAERFKITKEAREELAKGAKAAKSTLADLDRMEELEKEGKLDTPGYVEFLNRSGLDIPALMNPGSEEFQKIANNFTRDAKNYFGGRVSNFEIEQFLKTVPSLSQSPEGRKRVISNLKRLARGGVEYYRTAREITAENDGVPPYDLSEQVEDRIDKKLDKIAEQFKQDLAREVPKGQNRLITALQATAGSSIGSLGGVAKAVGKVAGPAYLGARVGGAFGGPVGAGVGGVAGGLGGLFGL